MMRVRCVVVDGLPISCASCSALPTAPPHPTVVLCAHCLFSAAVVKSRCRYIARRCHELHWRRPWLTIRFIIPAPPTRDQRARFRTRSSAKLRLDLDLYYIGSPETKLHRISRPPSSIRDILAYIVCSRGHEHGPLWASSFSDYRMREKRRRDNRARSTGNNDFDCIKGWNGLEWSMPCKRRLCGRSCSIVLHLRHY
jgi:hypothetical protein